MPRPLLSSPRAVITAVFFAFAFPIGLWSGAIPALMRQTGLSINGLGWAITLHTAAYIGAMAATGRLARHVPVRRLIFLALLVNLPCWAAVFAAPTPAVLIAALMAAGVFSGLLDLAMNAEATAVEREAPRPMLLSVHAAASVGFAVGALVGSVVATQVAPLACAALALAVSLPVAWAQRRLGPRAQAPAPRLAVPTRGRPRQGVAVIGVVLGLTITGEMASQMWSARFLERQAAELAAWAGAGAALFAGFQAVMRLAGDVVRRRWNDRAVIIASLAVAAVGYLTVSTSQHFVQSLVGFALVGLGLACVIPCCFAIIAREAREQAAAALGMASLVAGSIRLPAPLALGALTAGFGDATAFAVVGGGLLLALGLTLRLRR